MAWTTPERYFPGIKKNKNKKHKNLIFFQPAVVTSGSDKVSSPQDENGVGIETLLTRLPFVKFLILHFFS